MKITLSVLMTIISIALPVTGLATELDIKAITAKPTADNPQFDNKEAWPGLVGDEYFQKEKWPKARLLIWAPPRSDEAGGRRSSTTNGQYDPANWIDAATGKPADAIPDMETDVILPDSDKPYKVTSRNTKGFTCRHLTVGRNANFEPGGGGALPVFGNLWVRATGRLYVYRTLKMVGSHDTFFRQDWPEDGKLKKLHDTGAVVPFDPAEPKANPWWKHARVSYFALHDKPGKTTEIRGFVSCEDEFRVLAGTFIVGRYSRFLCGNAAMLQILRDGAIALMDGAMIGKDGNEFQTDCRLEGAITGGTPDRPIKRDARLGVGYSNWMNLTFPAQKRRHVARYGMFSADLSGNLIGYPAPGSDARLVVGWHRIGSWIGHRGWNMTGGFYEKYAELQPKITLWVGSDAEIENVRFEDLHRGGIVLPDASAPRKWKNVTFGAGCLSKDPKKLIREYQGKMHRGRPMEPLKPEKKYTSM